MVGILTGPERFAVPIDVARDVAAQLGTTGQAAHGWLGVDRRRRLDRSGGGVRVRGLVPGEPGRGRRTSSVDDIVLAVGDVEVGTVRRPGRGAAARSSPATRSSHGDAGRQAHRRCRSTLGRQRRHASRPAYLVA